MNKIIIILFFLISTAVGFGQSSSLEFRNAIISSYQSSDQVSSLAKLVFDSDVADAFSPKEWAQLLLRNWKEKAKITKVEIIPTEDCVFQGYDISAYLEKNDRTLPMSGLVVIHLKNAIRKEKSDSPCDPKGWQIVETNNIYYPYGIHNSIYYISGGIKLKDKKNEQSSSGNE